MEQGCQISWDAKYTVTPHHQNTSDMATGVPVLGEGGGGPMHISTTPGKISPMVHTLYCDNKSFFFFFFSVNDSHVLITV